MAYNNVFRVQPSGKSYYYYEKDYYGAVKRIKQLLDEGTEYMSVYVWKNAVHHDDNRRPQKGWNWREFMMAEHIYVEDKRIPIR
jgi:hypothetical protein